MLTPMFPEPQTSQPRVTPAEAIAAISRGNHKQSVLVGLNDLGRADIATFKTAWAKIPEDRRAQIVRELIELAESDVLLDFSRVFRTLLDDPSPVVRQLAISGLWEDESVSLIPVLISLMSNDPSIDVRAEAAISLGRFSMLASIEELEDEHAIVVREALSQMARSLTEPDLVRRRAMESLAAYGHEANVNELIDVAYLSDDLGMRTSAIFAMGRSSDRRWLPAIIAEFSSTDPEIRFEAARACGELGDQDAVSGLANLIKDDDAEVQFAAIAALGAIGGRGAIRVLSNYARTCPPAHQEAVDDAVAEAKLITRAIRELP